jgi:hypothetical protein
MDYFIIRKEYVHMVSIVFVELSLASKFCEDYLYICGMIYRWMKKIYM